MLQASCHPAPGARPQAHCELADIVRLYGPAYRSAHRLPLAHLKVLQAIESCRTAALGGHRECCASCGFERYAYNSCRNRHCPKCQSLAKEQWLEARQVELLPVGYFHNVFTLPHQLNPLILCHERNQRAMLNLLFQATAQTLLQFGRNNLGGTLGTTLVLHTWDQQLRPHFHLHCVIPGGVLSLDRAQWLPAHRRFLFPVRALSKVFRGKFLDGLRELYDTQQLQLPATVKAVAPLTDPRRFYELLSALRRKPWVVYSKAPFAGPEKLLNYLGHYTHRVAISNARLLCCDDGQVTFHYRDRAAGDIRKTLTLPADEFLRRFLCHVLPSGFQRIRHYGLLASRTKHDDLARCRQLLGTPTPPPPVKKTTAEWILLLLGIDLDRCPRCGQRELQRMLLLSPYRAPSIGAPPAPPEDDSS
ncbi:MAG TPA: IS91 family transposase [Gemmataceae bacterium]|nr:IS91 family transposase [Gemmataceae bacterium]